MVDFCVMHRRCIIVMLLHVADCAVRMVIAISVGIVLASLLFCVIVRMAARLVVVDVPDDVLVLRVIGPLFCCRYGLRTWSHVEGKRI